MLSSVERGQKAATIIVLARIADGLGTPHAPGSHEYVLVQSGTLRLTVGEHDYALAAGDSLYFAADVAHAYANTTAAPATYYVAALIMRPRRPGSRRDG